MMDLTYTPTEELLAKLKTRIADDKLTIDEYAKARVAWCEHVADLKNQLAVAKESREACRQSWANAASRAEKAEAERDAAIKRAAELERTYSPIYHQPLTEAQRDRLVELIRRECQGGTA